MRKGGSYYYYAWITYKGDMPPPQIKPGQQGARFASNIGEDIEAVKNFIVS